MFDSSALMSCPKHSLRYVATCTLLVIDQLYACYATTERGLRPAARTAR